MSSAHPTSDSQYKLRDVPSCRGDFPALDQQINGHPLVYLDSAASSQQPAAVIDAIAEYQRHSHANVHRGVHTLSHRATDAYEGARDDIAAFLNANNRREIIFTSGTTDGINLVAQSFCRPKLGPGKRIVISHLEHHSNIVPWQLVCEQTGAELTVAPINERGEVLLDELYALLDETVVLLAITHVSNALGTVLPLADIVRTAHGRAIPVLVDGAQAAPHMALDMQALDVDFYALSAHKMYGPTGIGVLFGKERLLEAMPPWKGGGDMILEVRFSGTVYNELPYKFEAGTPNISGAAGLGATVRYLQDFGMANIARHEAGLLAYLTSELGKVDAIRLYGTAATKASVQSFLINEIHPHDLGTILDHQGVAIRTGHHCAMPVMEFFDVPGTARASLGMYNNRDDIDRLVAALGKAVELFR